MNEEVKEKKPESSEQPTEAPKQEITLENLIEDAPVETPGQKPKKEEPKKEESEISEEKKVDEKPEKKKEEEKVKSIPDSKEELKEEPKKEEEIKTEELTPEQQEWKKDHENRKAWQGELTRKSQLINQLSDEEIRNIQARTKLEKELEDVKLEALPEYLEYEVGKDEVTDEPINYKLPNNEIQKIVDREIRKAQEVWVKKMGPVLAKGEQAVQEAEGLRKDAESNTALVGIRRYFDDFKDSGFDLGDDPIQTLNDINEAGETHPDYDKFLNLNMVAERARAKEITMKDAHIEIFGKSEQAEKAKKKLKEEQEIALEEKPGQTPKTPTADEDFEKGLGIGTKKTVNVYD